MHDLQRHALGAAVGTGAIPDLQQVLAHLVALDLALPVLRAGDLNLLNVCMSNLTPSTEIRATLARRLKHRTHVILVWTRCDSDGANRPSARRRLSKRAARWRVLGLWRLRR